MNCMKCGREIALGQAFCKDCLSDMERYPVKPDTPVQLPPQPEIHVNRRAPHPRKTKKPEDQLTRLRKLVRIQTLALLAVVLLFIASTVFFLAKLYPRQQPIRPGQNYSTVEQTTPDQ